MNSIHRYIQRTFASLSIRNYRLYFFGQAISLSGTWMQTVAQGLLVLDLTGSGTKLGTVIAVQTIPILAFGAWGGVVADRYSKRRILYLTQSSASVISLITAGLIFTGHIELWMVYILAALLGFVKVFDNPTRQTFVREMVGNDLLTNAVSLNSMEINLARVIGPAIAGVIVATVGLGACFLVDGLTYFVVIIMLFMMDASQLNPVKRVTKAKGQLSEGVRYIWRTTVIRNVLVMMVIIGTFTYEFSVTLPLLSEFTFDRGPSGYATLTSAMGLGAVIGGLYTAGRRTNNPLVMVISAALFGVSVTLVGISPTFALAVVMMVVVGFFSISFTSLGNVTLQLNSRSDMQGRVMSFWSIAFLGTTPIGGPIMGAIGEHMGARTSLVLGGLAAVAAAGLGLATTRHNQQMEIAAAQTVAPPAAD